MTDWRTPHSFTGTDMCFIGGMLVGAVIMLLGILAMFLGAAWAVARAFVGG